jgi:hypothetical protein
LWEVEVAFKKNDPFKHTFLDYVSQALDEYDERFRTKWEDGDLLKPLHIICHDGVTLKIWFKRINPGETPVEYRSGWEWCDEFGRAKEAVDGLVSRAASGSLPAPEKQVRVLQGKRVGRLKWRGVEVTKWAPDPDAIAAEVVTDRAFREARVRYTKWREEKPEGTLHSIFYKLWSGALLQVRPDGRWRWRDHAVVVCQAVDEADAAWRRHLARKARAEGKETTVPDDDDDEIYARGHPPQRSTLKKVKKAKRKAAKAKKAAKEAL